MTRPSRHIRVVKTKRGRRRVLVNRNITKRFKKRVTILPKERKIFSLLSNHKVYNHEFGGHIDFKKDGRIERFRVQKGDKDSILLDDDYELLYHTHPDKLQNPASPEDIISLLKSPKQQAEVVFRNGEAFTVIKTPKTRALSKLPATKLFKDLDKAFLINQQSHSPELSWKKTLEDKGFIVSIDKNPTKKLDIKIKPVEPK